MSSEQRYSFTTIPPAHHTRILMEDIDDPPGHRVKYRRRRDKLTPGPKGTMYLPMCTCGAKDTKWYQTKPLAKRMWYKWVHINEVMLQESFPGIQDVTNQFKESSGTASI